MYCEICRKKSRSSICDDCWAIWFAYEHEEEPDSQFDDVYEDDFDDEIELGF